MTSDLQTVRGRVFFWIGMTILPVFWVFWMKERNFTRTQIRLGRIWAIIYLALLIVAWFTVPLFRFRIEVLHDSYSVVALHLGIALWLWFIFRVFYFSQIILGFIISIDITAMLSSLVLPALYRTPANPFWFIFPGIAALAHLMVHPCRCFIKKLGGKKSQS